MKWNIVSDSSCDLFARDITDEQVDFSTIPFTIHLDEEVYTDDESLDVDDLVERMERCASAPRTSCPAPGLWAEAFERAKVNFAITISGALSASQSSAQTGRKLALEQDPDKHILVLDSHSTGPGLAMCIEHLRDWAHEGLSFEAVSERAASFLEHQHTVFALSSFNNLVRNGRMNRIIGFIAHKLGMWGIGIGGPIGEIQIKGTARGPAKAITMILEELRSKGYTGGELAISHCQNEGMALRLRERIQELWANAPVTIRRTRGLDSFYAERGGVIVAFIS